MAQAARTLHVSGEPLGPALITIEMKTTFVQPATLAAGVPKATGHVLHRTRSMAFCEGHVYDGTGALCVHASGAFEYVRLLPGRQASGGDG
ncbi:MAG: PaaI family thioesterase [Proteobacteria bacterium]|jgi:acyl-coenzyme A thioesterase PaaI-like protein|nr:PaaI family thioesterase [Pseudomonadota bacterium]